MVKTRVHYILLLTCIILPDVRSEGACKWTDSIPSEGACFLYNATELSYAEANSSCQSIGGVLAKLKTMTQLLEAIQNVPYTTYIWIGANDISVEGTWMWEDGGVATELNELWYNDEPDNGTDHDCADIYKYFTLSGLYDDVCSKRCPFLCMEKDEITTLCPEASTFKTNSPPTTELTTNELAATEPTAKAILTSTSTAQCSNRGTYVMDFNVLFLLLFCIVTYLVF